MDNTDVNIQNKADGKQNIFSEDKNRRIYKENIQNKIHKF